MHIGAIIPLKVISKSKSRLRKAHSTSEYNKLVDNLSEILFYTVLSAVFFSKKVSDLLIATSDPKISEVLSNLGINSYLDRWTDLNLIIGDGISILRGFGCDMVLILMADLPRIYNQSIDTLLDAPLLADNSNCLVILRSLDRGTTGLIQKPLGITHSFLNYPNSAEKHLDYAMVHNIPNTTIETMEFSFDVDTIADLLECAPITEGDLIVLIQQLRNLLDQLP